MAEENTPQEPQEVEQPQQEEQPQEEEKSRTEQQFEKLTESNQELKQERDKYKNLLDSLAPSEVPDEQKQQYKAPINQAPGAEQFQALKQEDIDTQFAEMVDEKGFLDGQKLLSTLKGMDERARSAEEKAKRVADYARREAEARRQQQKTETMRRVHDKYPQLDPESDQFDEKFYDLVRNDLIGQMMEGKEDPMAAAAKWHGELYKEAGVTKEEKEIKETKETQKEQINATRPRSASMTGYYESEEEDALRDKVRKGKKGALAELLKRKGL